MIVIETPRLVLRHFHPEDADFVLELLNQPGWLRFIGDRGVVTLQNAAGYINTTLVPAYAKNGFGFYAMERRDDHTPLGMCGLIKRTTLDDVDIGFALLARHEGQGYAHEAASATVRFAREVVGLKRLVAITHLDNHRSQHLLRRLGMEQDRLVQLGSDPEVLRLFAMEL